MELIKYLKEKEEILMGMQKSILENSHKSGNGFVKKVKIIDSGLSELKKIPLRKEFHAMTRSVADSIVSRVLGKIT